MPPKSVEEVVVNDLEQDIILEIDGETWHILANDTKVIEKEPGTYNYTARYSTTDQLAAEGKSTGRVKSIGGTLVWGMWKNK